MNVKQLLDLSGEMARKQTEKQLKKPMTMKCVVYWVADKQVSTEPLSSVVDKKNAKENSICQVKWKGRGPYSAKIITISDDKETLKAAQDALEIDLANASLTACAEETACEDVSSKGRKRKKTAKLIAAATETVTDSPDGDEGNLDKVVDKRKIQKASKKQNCEAPMTSIHAKACAQKKMFKTMIEQRLKSSFEFPGSENPSSSYGPTPAPILEPQTPQPSTESTPAQPVTNLTPLTTLLGPPPPLPESPSPRGPTPPSWPSQDAEFQSTNSFCQPTMQPYPFDGSPCLGQSISSALNSANGVTNYELARLREDYYQLGCTNRELMRENDELRRELQRFQSVPQPKLPSVTCEELQFLKRLTGALECQQASLGNKKQTSFSEPEVSFLDGITPSESSVEEDSFVQECESSETFEDQVELVKGYAALVTKAQLANIHLQSNGKTPKKVLRRVLDLLFTPEEMKNGCAQGKRHAVNKNSCEKSVPLDPVRLQAAREFVLRKCGEKGKPPVLGLPNFNRIVNLKCSEARR